jgi:hypothetical protein
MDLDNDFADLLNDRKITREMIFQSARRYTLERLAEPDPNDLHSDLVLMGADAGRLTDELAADGPGLQEVALAVLTAAWQERAERPRIVRCLDDVSGRLPVTDSFGMAVMLVYGLHLLLRTGSNTEETTQRRPDGTFITCRTSQKGALALILKALARDRVEPPELPARTPAEAHHTLILLDIQDSSALPEPERLVAVGRLKQVLRDAFEPVGIPFDRAQPNGRGDGYQFAVPEPEAGLTEIVTALPGQVGKLLAGALPGVQVRLGLHSDLLRPTTNGWDGDGLALLDRFTNAPEVKRRLTASGQQLATVISLRAWQLTHFRGYGDNDYEQVFVEVNGVPMHVYLKLT